MALIGIVGSTTDKCFKKGSSIFGNEEKSAVKWFVLNKKSPFSIRFFRFLAEQKGKSLFISQQQNIQNQEKLSSKTLSREMFSSN